MATLLNNGMVLIAAGYDSTIIPVASKGLYWRAASRSIFQLTKVAHKSKSI
jgi:type IV secretory pathway VirB3-like protein